MTDKNASKHVTIAILDQPVTSTNTATPSKNHHHKSQKIHALFAATKFNFLVSMTNPYQLGFALGMPLFMYFMFGVGAEYSQYELAHGNVSAQILVSMTTYGALIALSTHGVNTVLERTNGWVRQIALTPLGVGGWTISKIVSGLMVTMLLIAVTFSIGGIVEAEMEPSVWVATAVTVWLTSAMASPMGLAAAYWVRSDSAFAVVGGGSSVLAFASGMFIPLDQLGELMKTIAPYMPFYGVNRVPLAFIFGLEELELFDIASVIVWFVIFTGLALLGAKYRVER
ncbi:MAG: ABC transporter permease [Actinomycetaceae bacterium]|nr:ABC transporter permease [Actinomycetaceae bacterium]